MRWSVSNARMFRRCPRQWYFKNILANYRAKDGTLPRKVYLLGKLQNIGMWRGTLVDKVLNEMITYSRRKGQQKPKVANMIGRARNLFDRQLAFARQHRLHEAGFTPSQYGDDFVAFFSVEYGGTVPEDEVTKAWEEVEQALCNISKIQELRDSLPSADKLITQRRLTFHLGEVAVQATPDLVAFYADAPPLIVDWKVYAGGIQEAGLQLGIYALALSRCSPHRDFPDYSRWGATDTRLMEVQLLQGRVRSHRVADEDIERLEEYIAATAMDIELACLGATKPRDELEPEDFPVAWNPRVCTQCQYKKVCWEES